MQIVVVIQVRNGVDVFAFYAGSDADYDAVGLEIMLVCLKREGIVFNIMYFKTVDM